MNPRDSLSVDLTDPSASVPGYDRPVRYAGLMRCCVATIDECAAPTRPGAVLVCTYESRLPRPDAHAMTVAADGAWERHVMDSNPTAHNSTAQAAA